ncbi:isopentenyl-diphosphate Delta-isomerase 1 [Harmonia axyridis]|uniref:isopentenyl-diphosphate Delta-isomerase 1 n=1 Tax=Harmonia axyridis TaxID=115357 RepID=UPI001E276FC9|nr:isopentenyl-diphosphate Delta-isomerase 1 [Harmonia axyridis]XP_045461281.1 isopentenyl-diphosphate Delta-isomerase 1 [Harmonia axyridis]
MLISALKRVISLPLLKNISTTSKMTKEISEVQEKAMSENCFLVSRQDKVIGTASKRDCHKVQANGNILLHRALSVFLFNSHGDLLLQKRSSEKITYPDHYTNSCCSHPIADIPGEEVEENALGVKRAAIRRLNFELGIPLDSMKVEDFTYLTRIIYKDEGNGKWGEHEIDYILFLKGDYKLKPNPNEISEISYVPRTEVDNYIPTLSGPLTPWFNLILKHRLKLWWDNLDDLESYVEHKKILKFDSH